MYFLYHNVKFFHVSGVVYQNKLYFIPYSRSGYNDPLEKTYDPATNTIKRWPNIPGYMISNKASMVRWRDSFLFFDTSGVHFYNITAEEWLPTYVSYGYNSIFNPKAALLPNDEVLVVGAYCGLCTLRAYVYNISGKTWSDAGTPANNPLSAALVQLGSRYFLMGGFSNVTEEYNYKTRNWTVVNTRLAHTYSYMDSYNESPTSAIAVPAELFAKLPGGCQGIN
jgi:hypothetical protein